MIIRIITNKDKGILLPFNIQNKIGFFKSLESWGGVLTLLNQGCLLKGYKWRIPDLKYTTIFQNNQSKISTRMYLFSIQYSGT